MEPSLDLEEARRFHGHLGPWLVLGLRLGQTAMERLEARKYFGVRVRVEVPSQPPPSCLVDGLQLATGATYGKRNIELIPADEVRVVIQNTDTQEALEFRLPPGLPERFADWLAAEGDEAASRRAATCSLEELFTCCP
jgi:formylmethanofuran dehydrogenase subunit E